MKEHSAAIALLFSPKKAVAHNVVLQSLFYQNTDEIFKSVHCQKLD